MGRAARWAVIAALSVAAAIGGATWVARDAVGASSSDPPVVQTRRALDFLGDAALDWHLTFDCSGCHKQSITLAALGTARAHGYEDAKPGVVGAILQQMLEGTSGQGGDGCFSLRGLGSFTVATTLDGRGLEAYDRRFSGDHRSNLLDAADCLLNRQDPDGRLASDHTELPVAQGSFITTAHGVFVWVRAHEVTGSAAYRGAADDAVAWLRGEIPTLEASPSTFKTQDKAMLLAGLGANGAGPSDADVVRVRDLLAGEQLADGSWKLSSGAGGGNAYATGQAVFAMRTAGYDRTDPAVELGTGWLLDHQLADGSWPADFWEGNSPSELAPSMWGALALATYSSPLASLRVEGGASAIVSWSDVEGASSYDLVRGVTSSLAALADRVDLGPVDCLAASTTFTSVADGALPSAGECLFYVMRIRWAGNEDLYGRSTSGLDRVAASGDCTP